MTAPLPLHSPAKTSSDEHVCTYRNTVTKSVPYRAQQPNNKIRPANATPRSTKRSTAPVARPTTPLPLPPWSSFSAGTVVTVLMDLGQTSATGTANKVDTLVDPKARAKVYCPVLAGSSYMCVDQRVKRPRKASGQPRFCSGECVIVGVQGGVGKSRNILPSYQQRSSSCRGVLVVVH